MHVRPHLGINRLDGRAAEHPAEELNGMAAHIHRHATPGTLHIPEMCGVRAVMFLGLLEQHGMTERAAVEQLLQADILGSKAQFLRIHQLDLGSAAGGEHLVGLRQAQAHRFLEDDMLARSRGVQSDFAVQVVWNPEDHQVNLIQIEQFAVVGEMPRDAVPARKRASLATGGRGHGDYFGAGATLKGVGMNGGDEARSYQAHANFILHDRLQPFRYS